jgi:hypothetical protein
VHVALNRLATSSLSCGCGASQTGHEANIDPYREVGLPPSCDKVKKITCNPATCLPNVAVSVQAEPSHSTSIHKGRNVRTTDDSKTAHGRRVCLVHFISIILAVDITEEPINTYRTADIEVCLTSKKTGVSGSISSVR